MMARTRRGDILFDDDRRHVVKPVIPENPTLGDLTKIATDTIASWVKERCYDSEKFQQYIRNALDQNQKQILLKLMGFDDRWGRLEIDHCNGRDAYTTAGQHIAAEAKEAVTRWLSAQAGNLPELTPEILEEMKKEYLQRFRSNLRDALWKKAEQAADELATKIIEEVQAANAKQLQEGFAGLAFSLMMTNLDKGQQTP